MKINYLINQRFPTEKAYGRQISKMCSNFARLPELSLEVLCPTRGNLAQEKLTYGYTAHDFKVTRVRAPDFYWPGRLDALAFAIKSLISALVLVWVTLDRDPDIVYSRDELPLYILSFFREGLVFEAHKLQSKRSFMYQRFSKLGVKLIAITSALKTDFIKMGYQAERILVAPDGVDAQVIEQEEASPSNVTSARKQLDLPMDRRIGVYTGSLFAWKGIYTIADTAMLMPEVLFVLVGGDQRGDETDLRDYLAKHNIENVKITGYVSSEDTIRDYLAAADFLLLPNTAQDLVSQKYTSPLKLFSYMAARRPIVASDLPSLREVLNDANALLVTPDDASALADGVKQVLGDPALAERISQTAFRDAHHYTWEKRAHGILDFIR